MTSTFTSALQWLARNPLLIALVVMVLIFQVMTGTQLTWPNLRGVLLDSAIIAIVAVPAGMLIISGYIDLSVGSTLALGGVVAGMVMKGSAGNPALAVALAVLVGAFVGLVNGVLSTRFALSSFIVTLGTLTAVRGVAQLLTPVPSNTFGPEFGFLGVGYIAGVPVAVWIAAIVVIAGSLVLQITPVGRHIYAIGVSREAAYLSGVNIRRIPFVLFLLSGSAAGLAGAITVARLNSAPAGQIGSGFELAVLTAILLGGVALMGGQGSMFGVTIGVLFLGLLKNGLTLIGVTSFWQNVASGAALIAAIGLAALTQALRQRIAAREATRLSSTAPATSS